MAKVRLGPLARIVRQWQEGFATVSAPGSNIAADLVVTATILLLVAQPAIHLGGRVTLLPRSLLVRNKDLVDPLLVAVR